MSNHIVAESESNLSQLLDRVVEGEGLVITRNGRPVAELKPMRSEMPRRAKKVRSDVAAEDEFLKLLDEIPQHVKDAAVAAVRAVRDEDEE